MNAQGLVINIARNTPNGFTPRIKDVIVQTLFYRRQQIRGVGKGGGVAKPKCTSDRETNGSIPFGSLLPK